MLRLIHTQVAAGGLLVSDIDDGLPRRTARRLAGDPKKYERDGSSPGGGGLSTKPGINNPKQKCYVPRQKIGETTVAGFIDLMESDTVLLSQNRGVIAGLVAAGHMTVTSFVAADVLTPVLTTAVLDSPGAGDITLTGTNFTSLAPDVSSVILTGTGAVTLTSAQIIAGGGSFAATSIVILAASVPGIAVTTTSAQVRSDSQLSAVVAVT